MDGEEEREGLGRERIGIGAAGAVLLVPLARRPSVDAAHLPNHLRGRRRVAVGGVEFDVQV